MVKRTGIRRTVKLSKLRSDLKGVREGKTFFPSRSKIQISNIQKAIKLTKQGFRIPVRPRKFTSKSKALEAIKKNPNVTEKLRSQVTTRQFFDPKTGKKIFVIIKKPN